MLSKSLLRIAIWAVRCGIIELVLDEDNNQEYMHYMVAKKGIIDVSGTM